MKNPAWIRTLLAISLTLTPISIMPRRRHLSSWLRWLYLSPMAITDIAGGALDL